MNEVFLDTETTGLSFKEGHKVVEIACIETKDLIPTGKVFHKLINPKRSIPSEAFKVHGFSEEFLKDKDTFDIIIFIKSKKEERLRRFVSKHGSKALFDFLNSQQLSDKKKSKFCDHIVVNEKNLKILKKNLSLIIAKYE